jgi:hypothetical protein
MPQSLCDLAARKWISTTAQNLWLSKLRYGCFQRYAKQFHRPEHIYIACGYTDLRKSIDGLALLVLFFVAGVIRTCGSFADIKRS